MMYLSSQASNPKRVKPEGLDFNMPRTAKRRRTYSKKKTYNKGFFPSGVGTSSYVQNEALKIIKRMREKKQKYESSGTPSVGVNDAGTITLLNETNQGDDDTNRDGSAIYLDNIQLNGYFSPGAPADPPFATVCRVMIFIDRQPNGSAIAPADLLEGTGSAMAVNRFVDAQQASKRIRVLRDKKYVISVNHQMGKYFDFYVPLKELKTEYESGESTPESNAVGVLFISNVPSETSSTPKVTWESKCVFRD